jgi:hypothetical protein
MTPQAIALDQRAMFEKSFHRPRNYRYLSPADQWEIDASLGILDWEGCDLTHEDRARIEAHYL